MQFVIGVISSLTATALAYLFRYQLGSLLNTIFFRVYPNVKGDYRIYIFEYSNEEQDEYIPDEELEKIEGDSEQIHTLSTDASDRDLLDWLKEIHQNDDKIFKIKLEQFTNRVKGEVYSLENGKHKTIEKVVGRITPSRVLLLNSETKDDHHHNFGTYLLTIKNDTRILKGTNSGLCISCNDATSRDMILEKE
jgi:hypothetical protein